jgi:hypothetical protein
MGHVLRAHALHLTRPLAAAAGLALLAACGSAPPDTRAGLVQTMAPAPTLPDATGWGVHVLAIERGTVSAARVGVPGAGTVWIGPTWVGTHGTGLYTLPRQAREWQPVRPTGEPGGGPADVVNSLAIGRDTTVIWYGTAGGGFGRSTDGGQTWRTWSGAELGNAWQHVAHGGITIHRDTVYIATTTGLRITGDGGASWRCIRAAGAPRASDGCTEQIDNLPSEYLFAVAIGRDGALHVGHLRGLSISRDRGRSWTDVDDAGLSGRRVRSLSMGPDSSMWVLTETSLFSDSVRLGEFREIPIRVAGYTELPGAPRSLVTQPGALSPLIATSYGMLGLTADRGFRLYYLGVGDQYRPAGDIWTAAWWGPPMFPLGGSAAGLARVLAGELPPASAGAFTAVPRATPAAPRAPWLERPVADEDGNPYADGMRLFGATLGGTAAPQPGVQFNNPAGTPVRAVAPGVVTGVTEAADGAVVAIRHDAQREGQIVYSSYVHGGEPRVTTGQRVGAGDVIAVVGAGAPQPHGVRLRISLVGLPDAQAAPAAGIPPLRNINPQLAIRPLPGTGVVAGQVFDDAGQPVRSARLYGLVLPYPTESPFSWTETYDADSRGMPGYDEHFAVGDVPAGTYTLGVTIGTERVWRRVQVAAGQVTWVEFRP